MKPIYRLAWCALTAAIVAGCGGDPAEDPGQTEHAEHGVGASQVIAARREALSSSQADIEARIYADALTGRAAEVAASGSQNGWNWRVIAPRFQVTSTGIRFQGSLVASKPSKLRLSSASGLSSKLAVTSRTALTKAWQPALPVKPVVPVQVGLPQLASTSFDLPASMTYDAGTLQLEVSTSPVTLQRASESGTQNILSVNLAPYYSVALEVAPQTFLAGTTELDAQPSAIEIVPRTNYVRVRATVSVN